MHDHHFIVFFSDKEKHSEAKYLMSGRNQLCSHGQHIGEKVECEEAAKYLGKEFRDTRTRHTFPKGCYFLHQNLRIYFKFIIEYCYLLKDLKDEIHESLLLCSKEIGLNCVYF